MESGFFGGFIKGGFFIGINDKWIFGGFIMGGFFLRFIKGGFFIGINEKWIFWVIYKRRIFSWEIK